MAKRKVEELTYTELVERYIDTVDKTATAFSLTEDERQELCLYLCNLANSVVNEGRQFKSPVPVIIISRLRWKAESLIASRARADDSLSYAEYLNEARNLKVTFAGIDWSKEDPLEYKLLLDECFEDICKVVGERKYAMWFKRVGLGWTLDESSNDVSGTRVHQIVNQCNLRAKRRSKDNKAIFFECRNSLI